MGNRLLLIAIATNSAKMVEILLKDGNANPNVVNNDNVTALMFCGAYAPGNVAIRKLLTKYGFDYAKLVNKREHKFGTTVFHNLCNKWRTNDRIAFMKYLFQVCKNIPNCSINILAKNREGRCGLHMAIADFNVDMVTYLLENVYFPNNDKSNPSGIAFMNTLTNDPILLAQTVFYKAINDYDAKRHLKIFKLLIAYGMNVDGVTFHWAITAQFTKIVCFILQENLYPLYTFQDVIVAMFGTEGVATNNEEIWKALYNYGINYNLIIELRQHVAIITLAAGINLSSFKTILSIVLAHHGINDLKDYNQCSITNGLILAGIAHNPQTTQGVKLFIDALISGDESKVSKMDETTGIQVILTCVNNHEINSSTNDNRIVNYKERCSVCDDNGNGCDSVSGFECNECKNFICDDCVIVQKISKKIDMIGTQTANMYFSSNVEYKLSILEEVVGYKNNKQLIGKVKSSIDGTIS